jgi:hypothetical protein
MYKKESKRTKYLVEYDLTGDKSCRRKFYKTKRKIGLSGASTTRSVIVTDSRPKAQALKSTAERCGVANIYKVIPKKKSMSKKKTSKWL